MKLNPRILALAACLLMALSTVLPWIQKGEVVLTGFRPGLGHPGIMFLVGAALLAGLLFLSGKWIRRVAILLSAYLVFAAFDQWWTAVKIEGAHPAWGVYLLLLSAGALLFQAARRREYAH